MNQNEIYWKQYQQHIDLHKFYLELAVKLFSFYFAVSGAMISFYFTNTGLDGAKYAFYLPWLISIGLFIFFSLGAHQSDITRNDVFNLRNKLGLEVAPELRFLTLLLLIFSLVLLACITGLSYILFCQ